MDRAQVATTTGLITGRISGRLLKRAVDVSNEGRQIELQKGRDAQLSCLYAQMIFSRKGNGVVR